MARSFVAATGHVVLNLVGSGPSTFPYGTLAVVVRPVSNPTHGPLASTASGADFSVALAAASGAPLVTLNGLGTLSQPSSMQWVAADGWQIWCVTKASGGVAPRFHKYVFSTGTWSHENGTTNLANGATSIAGWAMGIVPGAAANFDGDIAVAGVASSVTLTDQQVESLSAGLQQWLASMTHLYVLDQDTTSTPNLDLISQGADTGSTPVPGVAAASSPLNTGRGVSVIPVTASAPVPAEGQFVAYDHTHITATGGRDSDGAATATDTVTVVAAGGRDAVGSVSVYDHTHASWTGSAPAVPPASGSFTAYDTTVVEAGGERASAGGAAVYDTATTTVVGERASSGATQITDTTTVTAAGERLSTGAWSAVDETTVAASGESTPAGTFTAVDTVHATAAGARASVGIVCPDTPLLDSNGEPILDNNNEPILVAGALVDETAVGWVGSAPAVDAAEGQFTAQDTATVTASGERVSEGAAGLVDETTVNWVGNAPTVGTAEGHFTAYDTVTVEPIGERASTGQATVQDTVTVAPVGARDSTGTASVVDETHVTAVGERASTGAATVHDHVTATAHGERPSRGFCTAHDTTHVTWSAPTTLPDLRERHSGRRPDHSLTGTRPRSRLSGQRSSTL